MVHQLRNVASTLAVVKRRLRATLSFLIAEPEKSADGQLLASRQRSIRRATAASSRLNSKTDVTSFVR